MCEVSKVNSLECDKNNRNSAKCKTLVFGACRVYLSLNKKISKIRQKYNKHNCVLRTSF